MAGTRLGGRTVLLTGAGSGIGRSLARAAAERGARVVLWDASHERVEAVRAEIGGHARAQVVDVSDRAAVAEAAKVTGTIGVLVHTAVGDTGAPVLEASDEAIEQAYAAHVLSLHWVTRAFLPAMVARRGGHVVTVVTVGRAALGFADALRAEMRAQRTGVRTTLACPSALDTGALGIIRGRLPAPVPQPSADRTAARIVRAVESGRRRVVLPVIVSASYAPGSGRS